MLHFPLMGKSWWNFTGKDETFEAQQPDHLSRLYFPLCNEAGLLSAITPTLHGDIKTDQNHFLTLPVSTEDLHNTRSARNFWVYLEGKDPWSTTGSSATAQLARARSKEAEKCRLEAGALWHKVTRENRSVGLRAETLSFIPSGPHTVEIMQVTLTNISRKPIRLTPTTAVPIFGRSAENLRDHRHVTSLLHRINLHPHGVLVTPTMSFDERGHQLNTITSAVVGAEEDGTAPLGSFPTVASFIGEGGSFDAPAAVYKDLDVPNLPDDELQGREAVGALRFKTHKLAPGKSVTYLVLMGIAKSRKDVDGWIRHYGTVEKAAKALVDTKQFWTTRLNAISIETGEPEVDRWTRWVTLQPMLRKLFGCSFLPDFDYGRGGRGWRDLWQDCLALLLLEPESARELLLNNFMGVRINGTNATIIGTQPGEFIADRNNVSRTWMDHGVWPWITTELYIHQSGNLDILRENVRYFWDQDRAKTPAAESGSLLEHILIQHLTTYYNVGEHGNCRLEDADWNDGLDMAHDRGESVAFTAVYAGNMIRFAQALEKLQESGVSQIDLPEEFELLLESKTKSPCLVPGAKQDRLATYRSRTKEGVSGRKIAAALNDLAEDLRQKGTALAKHVRDQECLTSKSGHSWFNGYYDNHSQRVEGDHPKGTRMTLTGQVFPIMFGVATDEQVARCYLAAKRYLQDKKLGGFHLNTDFGDIQPVLGRAFSFAYGEKENGAFFSHMTVMFANALYQRGFVKEGFEVFSSLSHMALNTDVAKIYPGLPEYFNGEGRGLYHYLTGSASWYLLTLLTQVVGIRGQWGDLLLAPKLMPDQFNRSGQVIARTRFAGKRLEITYVNRSKKPYGKYRIDSVLLHGRSTLVPPETQAELVIPRKTLTDYSEETLQITVNLL